MKTKSLIAVLILAFCAVLLAGCGSSGQIGVVDMQKIMTDSAKAKALQTQFAAKRDSLANAADKEAAQKELMTFGQGLEKQIQGDLDKVLVDVSKNHGFTAIAYKGAIAQGGVDVTDEVVGLLK